MKNKIIVYVEKHSDGTYWGSTKNLPGGVTAFGSSLAELKKNLTVAYQDYYELAVELEEEFAGNLIVNPKFIYKLDLQSVFELLPEIKISSIASKAKINPSLLRQYKTGKTTASEEQSKKVLAAIHELGNELLSVSF